MAFQSAYSRNDFKVTKKEDLYKGFFKMQMYTVEYKGSNGQTLGPIRREIFERGNAAAIIPYDPKLDRVVLIEQFRVGATQCQKSPWLIEIVAGIIDQGESGEQTVIRELQEEAGLTCQACKYINSFLTTPGGSTECIDLFVGKVDSTVANGIHGLASESEDIKVFTVSLDEALEMVEQGQICNSIAIIGIWYLAMHKQQLQQEWAS